MGAAQCQDGVGSPDGPKHSRLGITRATLQAWIKDGKVTPPAPTLEGAVAKRFWSVKDVERLRNAKKEHSRKGRGRKPKR
jgi:hypothetical protein